MHFLSTMLQTNAVSYTILLVVYSLIEVTTGEVGPSTPPELLQLLWMTSFVSIWTTWMGRRTLASLRGVLITYAGCCGIVLGIGNLTGFIPVELPLTLLVCAIVAMVFVGTALYVWLDARSKAEAINKGLAAMRERRQKGSENRE